MRNFLKKKNKLLKIIATFALLLFTVLYACEKDFWDSTWAEEEAQTIEQVKTWYGTNKPEETLLRSSNEKIKIPVKPEWSRAFTTKNKDYKVVETDISSQGRLLFIDTACMAKYKETNDLKYRQCYTRMVFRIDLNTNDTVGFLMTVVPNLDWLEKSKYKPFMDVTYLYRSKQFGGEVLFHNLDGTFSNGWLYEKGKIVATVSSMDADSAEFSLRSTVCQTYANYDIWEFCTDYYTVHEDGDIYTGTSCNTIWEFTGYSQVCYEVSDISGGYGSGSTPGNPLPSKNPTTRTDCGSSNSVANSNAAITAMNANAPGVGGNVAQLMGQLNGYANQPNEYGIAVQYANDQYYAMNLTNDGNNPNFFVSGSFNQVKLLYSQNTYLVAHTHPQGTNSAPSPRDAMFLAEAYNGNATNIHANVVYGYGGYQYMVYVDNRSAFDAFCKNPNNSPTIGYNNPNAMFYPGSQLDNDYQSAYKILNQQYSQTDAQSYALSYALDKNNTGLKVSQNKNGTFKEQKTDTSGSGTNTTYSPKICP